MNTIKRMRGGLVALAAVTAAFMAVSVAPAMASPHWSDTAHGAKVSGSIAVSATGQTTKTCTAPSTQESWVESTGAIIYSPGGGNLVLNCGVGSPSMEMSFILKLLSTTSVQVAGSESTLIKSPWTLLSYWQKFSTVTDFVNGSGATASTMTFNKDQIGLLKVSASETVPMYATGTLKVTTSTGGLLTILP